MHPDVVAVMRELGINVADRRARQLARDDAEWADLVVTIGATPLCSDRPSETFSAMNRAREYWNCIPRKYSPDEPVTPRR